MPLRKKRGVALRLASQNRVGLTGIVHQEQRGHLWCWAACISMVLQGLGRTLKQCALASLVLPKICPNCTKPCNHKEDAFPECDIAYPIEGIEALWKEEFIKVQADSHQGPLSWKEVIKELEKGYALEILLGWSNDGGHLVLLIDAVRDSDGSTKILVADPSSGTRDVSPKDFDDALKNLNHGEWRLTWTGLHF